MSSQRKRSGLFLFFLLRFFAGAEDLPLAAGRADVLRGLFSDGSLFMRGAVFSLPSSSPVSRVSASPSVSNT